MTIGALIAERIERTRPTWNRPSWWSLLIVWLWVIGIVWCVYAWNADRAIAARQQTTEGLIPAHEPANRNQYVFTFSVDGKSFTGRESPKNQHVKVGDSVVVYYDPLNPSKNALTDFSDLSAENLGPVPVMVLGVGGLAFLHRLEAAEEFGDLSF